MLLSCEKVSRQKSIPGSFDLSTVTLSWDILTEAPHSLKSPVASRMLLLIFYWWVTEYTYNEIVVIDG